MSGIVVAGIEHFQIAAAGGETRENHVVLVASGAGFVIDGGGASVVVVGRSGQIHGTGIIPVVEILHCGGCGGCCGCGSSGRFRSGVFRRSGREGEQVRTRMRMRNCGRSFPCHGGCERRTPGGVRRMRGRMPVRMVRHHRFGGIRRWKPRMQWRVEVRPAHLTARHPRGCCCFIRPTIKHNYRNKNQKKKKKKKKTNSSANSAIFFLFVSFLFLFWPIKNSIQFRNSIPTGWKWKHQAEEGRGLVGWVGGVGGEMSQFRK